MNKEKIIKYLKDRIKYHRDNQVEYGLQGDYVVEQRAEQRIRECLIILGNINK